MNETISVLDRARAPKPADQEALDAPHSSRGHRRRRHDQRPPRPRKIIFINRFFYPDHSATSQLLSDLAFYLAEQGEPVTVITSRLAYDDASVRFPVQENVNGVQVRRVTTTGFGRAGLLGRAIDLLSFYVSAGLALLAACGRGDVVVVKTDPPLLSVMAAPIVRLRGGRLVNWLQDVYPELAMLMGVAGMNGPLGRVLQRLRDVSLRSAERNVVLGHRMAELIRSRGVAPSKIQIIPNWADEQAIRPIPPAENPLRRAWGLEGKFVVGYSGNLGRAHEFQTILGAAKILKDDESIRFLMIGGGHGLSAMRSASRDAGLSNVLFKPYQDRAQLTESLSAADAHWISLDPRFEGYIVPSKVYGVLAAGRPVIAISDRQGEIATLVRIHGCGYHVAIGDSVSLAGLVRKLAKAPGLLAQNGHAARVAAVAHFGRDRALSWWVDLLTNT